MRAFQISALIETAVRDERERIIAMNAPEIERINAYIKALEDAARQALEALHVVLKDDYSLPYEKIVAATDALRAALAEPVREDAVYWYVGKDGNYHSSNEAKLFIDANTKALHLDPPQWRKEKGDLMPLYAAPPQRKPLTDEELDALAIDEDGLPNSHIEFARAIEQAHGIKE